MLFTLEDKRKRTKEEIEDLLGKKMKKIPIKELVSFCGLKTSMRPVLGDIDRFRQDSCCR